ncbi:hypothetical protein ACFYNX_31530 [Streptomyces sp. NPDC007872]|uniref:hypothetical protein n=1 Tax=Streptomyces sp. NPDC007872 TaxID=3364782 RepID=UPI00369240AE
MVVEVPDVETAAVRGQEVAAVQRELRRLRGFVVVVEHGDLVRQAAFADRPEGEVPFPVGSDEEVSLGMERQIDELVLALHLARPARVAEVLDVPERERAAVPVSLRREPVAVPRVGGVGGACGQFDGLRVGFEVPQVGGDPAGEGQRLPVAAEAWRCQGARAG